MNEPTLALAAAAGLASFLSPCMLPVIPAFLAQLAGTTLGGASPGRGGAFTNAALFVAGFSVTFTVLGVALNLMLAGVAAEVLVWVSRVAGAVIIVLGLHLTGLLRLPILDRPYAMAPGRVTPILFGASFAVAWTPCVGPILGSVLALAAARPASAFPLLLAYAIGLGAPFLLAGLFPARAFAFLKKHRRTAAYLHVAFGGALIGMGVLVFAGRLNLLANFPLISEVFT